MQWLDARSKFYRYQIADKYFKLEIAISLIKEMQTVLITNMKNEQDINPKSEVN